MFIIRSLLRADNFYDRHEHPSDTNCLGRDTDEN